MTPLFYCFAALIVTRSRALVLRFSNSTISSGAIAHSMATVAGNGKQPITFQGFYNAYHTGRGIWKWNNALDAYQRHLGPLAGKPLSLAEVGVQSGGSITMWKSVLGFSVHYFGIDINPATQQFVDPTTSIFMGDQASDKSWDEFYSTVTPGLDVLVDDGGHSPVQMSVTFARAFEHINPGGYIMTEDIFNEGHVTSFLFKAAEHIGYWNQQVDSVHLYPGFLAVKKATQGLPPQFQSFNSPVVAMVDSWERMWTAISNHPGSTIVVSNPAWGSMFAAYSMQSIFHQFSNLYAGTTTDNPKGCATTSAPVCTSSIVNSPLQNKVTGVHVYRDNIFVEVALHPPVISALRKGTYWIPYGL
mmetsp:Transcript_112458/g.223474  ORF Transcript_112458/g.223474 Transcript_112458/m.223474 type:complete len:359 (-) Transcript_112458:87-1163(-)